MKYLYLFILFRITITCYSQDSLIFFERLGALNNYPDLEKITKKTLIKQAQVSFGDSSKNQASYFDYKKESFLNNKYHIVYNGEFSLSFVDGSIYSAPRPSYYKVEPSNGKYGVVDNAGKIIVPLIYESLSVIKDSLLLFKIKNKENSTAAGIMSPNQKMITKKSYTSLELINSNLYHFKAEILNKKGVISFDENWIIKPEFNDIQLFTNTYNNQYYVTSVLENKTSSRYGLCALNGKEIVPTVFNFLDFETNDLIKVFKGKTEYKQYWQKYLTAPIKGKFGMYNTNGKELVVANYDELHVYNNGTYIHSTLLDSLKTNSKSKKQIIYTNTGIPILAGEYDFINFIPSHNYFLFSIENKYGYANKDGAVINKNLEDVSFHFDKKHIGIKQNNKWGVIDATGNSIIPYMYDDFIYQHKNLIITSKNNKQGALNSSNKIIFPFEYDVIKAFGHGVLVQKNNLYGYFSLEGKQILPISYTKIDCSGFCSYIIAEQDNQQYKYNFDGKKMD